MRNRSVLVCVLMLSVSGCASIAGSTNTLTDDKIKSESAGALGYSG